MLVYANGGISIPLDNENSIQFFSLNPGKMGRIHREGCYLKWLHNPRKDWDDKRCSEQYERSFKLRRKKEETIKNGEEFK